MAKESSPCPRCNQSSERSRCSGASRAVPAGVSDIAERTELPKSTVSRLLGTLVELGAVEQSELLGVYALGELIIELSASASPGSQPGVDRPPAPGRSGRPDRRGRRPRGARRDEVYYLDQVDGNHEVQVRDWTGESVDAHVVSSGLVLMAYASSRMRAAFLAQPLEAWTDNSITDPTLVAHGSTRSPCRFRVGVRGDVRGPQLGGRADRQSGRHGDRRGPRPRSVVSVPGAGRGGGGGGLRGRDGAADLRSAGRPPSTALPSPAAPIGRFGRAPPLESISGGDAARYVVVFHDADTFRIMERIRD